MISKTLYDVFFKEYQVEKDDVVFSLGAYDGEEVEYLSERVGPNGKVFAIEAEPNAFKKLEENVSRYKHNNVITLNLAITDFTGVTNIVDVGGSNYTQKEQVDNSFTVNCTTMDQIVKDYSLTNIDYIKVNIEGDEKPMLNGFKEHYSIVKRWCISCHDFTGIENQKTFDFVTDFLKERNIEYRQYPSDKGYANFYVYA